LGIGLVADVLRFGIPESSSNKTLASRDVVRRSVAAIEWLARVLGAREAMRVTLPEGRIGHAELNALPSCWLGVQRADR
jgi:hypothetical protein